MKFISLCAGIGERMGESIPKSLLPFGEKPVLKYQIDMARRLRMEPVVVTGFRHELFNFVGVKKYVNPDYKKTNMLGSLFCAEEELEKDLVVSYGDIIYRKSHLHNLKRKRGYFVITVDRKWDHYWNLRYGTINKDTESLSLDHNKIIDIGKTGRPGYHIDARFVGLMKFSKKGLEIVKKIYHSDEEKWRNAYSTDLIMELIRRGYYVMAYVVENGWIEFDTAEDYKKALQWYREGSLSSKLKLQL